MPRVTKASPSVERLNSPCWSRHCSQAHVTKSAGKPAAVTCKLPFAEIASRRGAVVPWAVSSRSSMRHPKVETWAWTCVATPIPSACSPARAFTNCQALIRSSNSNPAPLVDRSVAGARFAVLSRGAFGFDVFLDGAIDFRMLVALDYCHICRREAGGAGSSQFYGGLKRVVDPRLLVHQHRVAPTNCTAEGCRSHRTCSQNLNCAHGTDLRHVSKGSAVEEPAKSLLAAWTSACGRFC